MIIVHTGQYGYNVFPIFFREAISQGASGVQLFFLASAFTLFLSFDYRKRSNESKSIIKFFIRRFFRIAPMYYIGIIYYLFQDGLGPRYWLGDLNYVSNLNIASNFLFINGVYPYWLTSVVPGGWSISVEMMFYLCLPLLFYKITSLNRAILFTLFSLGLSISINSLLGNINPIGSQRLWNEFLFMYFPSQLPIFGLGISAFYIIIKKDTYVSPIAFYATITIFLTQLLWGLIPQHFLYGLLFLIIIVHISNTENKLIVNRAFIFLGKISFSAYLVHFAVLKGLTYYNFIDYITINSAVESVINYLLRLTLTIVITSIIALVTYTLIEKPLQTLGKHFISKL